MKLILFKIYNQIYDKDIQKIIEDLPKIIKEIYKCVTNKIFRTRKLKITKKVFY